MIQFRSVLVPADNTGARRLNVIGIKKKKRASLGDLVTVVVDGADASGVVSDSEICQAVVVRTAKEVRRPDGSYVRFDDNAAVLVDKDGNPRGSRIFGPIAREVKEKGFLRIASLAQELV